MGISKSLVKYIARIYEDYRASIFELIDGVRRKPAKTVIYTSALSGVMYLVKNNPSERCFMDQLVTSQNDLIELSADIRNQMSLLHVLYLNQCMGERTLKRFNLGLASLILRLDRNPDCAVYLNQCEYLAPSYKSYLTERLVDIGIAGKWWFLNHKMSDFDVNPKEWD